MTLSSRISLLAELGHYLRSEAGEELELTIQKAYRENPWFTPENTSKAIHAIATRMLDEAALKAWTGQYKISKSDYPERTIGLVMAGNIPLVGFHDWLCVFASGQRARVKLSDKDKVLLPFLVKKMGEWEHASWAYTEFLSEGEHLTGFDAVIATGSNNTARYFEQYFAKYPNIIRRNRNGVAVLDGSESAAELISLGEDIFAYFGLGCRNVSKIYVPRDYNFEPLLEALLAYKDIVHHNKFKNNFDYNYTLLLLNNVPHLSNGCILLTEDASLHSRIASVHYAYYDDRNTLATELKALQSEIQVVVGKWAPEGMTAVPFGGSQTPGLKDYADGVDVLEWILGL